MPTCEKLFLKFIVAAELKYYYKGILKYLLLFHSEMSLLLFKVSN